MHAPRSVYTTLLRDCFGEGEGSPLADGGGGGRREQAWEARTPYFRIVFVVAGNSVSRFSASRRLDLTVLSSCFWLLFTLNPFRTPVPFRGQATYS